MEVYFIPVREGDAFLLRSGGETMLIDGGCRTKVHLLRAFMKAQGITGVTYFLNTHWHDDHLAGALALLKDGFSGERFYSPYPHEFRNPLYARLHALLEAGHIPYETVGHGDVLLLGAAVLHIYRNAHPGNNVNSGSLVIKVLCGERSLLLMADADENAQLDLLDRVGPGLKADVIKAAHHGARPSVPGFLEMVAPQAAVITNHSKAAERSVRQFKRHGIVSYFAFYKAVYMATDGYTWYMYQEK